MRVLLVKILFFGDVIYILLVFIDVVWVIFGIQFDWVVEEGFVEIFVWYLVVVWVILVVIWCWCKNFWQILCNGEWWCFKQCLKEVDYDLVIDVQGLLKSVWLICYVGKMLVVGFDCDLVCELFVSCFYCCVYLVVWGQYVVECMCQLFVQVLDYLLFELVGDYGLDCEQLVDVDFGVLYLVFLYGIIWDIKYWLEVYWCELVECMCECGWLVCLFWGSVVEWEWVGCLVVGLENVVVFFRLFLVGMVKVFVGVCVCVVVDIGFGYLVVVLDVLMLFLFGLINFGFIGVYGCFQVYLGSDFFCVLCLKKICIYQLIEEDCKLFDFKCEQLLCFIWLNFQCVVIQLEVMLLVLEIF